MNRVIPESPTQPVSSVAHARPHGRAERRWSKLGGAAWPPLLLILVPKCPFCWAAYYGLFAGLLGLRIDRVHEGLLVVMLVLVALVACSFAARSWRRGDFWTGTAYLAGVALVVGERFANQFQGFVPIGLGCLLGAVLRDHFRPLGERPTEPSPIGGGTSSGCSCGSMYRPGPRFPLGTNGREVPVSIQTNFE